jgi:putative hydrolase of HD superfamily
MEDILKLKKINELKDVYRLAKVKDRNESSAEHSWSCLIIADFFLSKVKNVDRLKVYELLIYHDLPEIITGDFPLKPGKEFPDKKEQEMKAAEQLRKELPEPIAGKFFKLFQEYEENKTREAKFAKLIDVLDSDIHEIDYPEDWEEWTEDYYMPKRIKMFNDFPELKDFFDDFVKYLRENKYLKR